LKGNTMTNTLLFSIVFLLSFASASSQIRTFVREYTYTASEADSKITARAIALEQVKRILLEEVGICIQSKFEMEDWERREGKEWKSGSTAKRHITALTAGITETRILEEKWDGEHFFIRAHIALDTSDVMKRSQNLMDQEGTLADLEASRQRADEALKEVENLKDELKKAQSRSDTMRVRARLVEETNALSASDWFEQGVNAHRQGRLQDAVTSFTKGIELRPNYAWAYFNRGIVEYKLKDYRGAIKDYDKAIGLQPRYVAAYYARGVAKCELHDHQGGIDDYGKAIRLRPNFARAYYSRASARRYVQDYRGAINDYDKVVELQPDYGLAYWGRGLARQEAGMLEAGCQDLRKAKSLGTNVQDSEMRPCK